MLSCWFALGLLIEITGAQVVSQHIQQGTLIGKEFNRIVLPRETSPFSEPTLCTMSMSML